MSIILTEDLTFNQAKIVVEAAEDAMPDGRKKLFLSGICMQGGIRNQNGRIYKVEEIRAAVDDINDRIKQGIPVLGELDHPAELNINLDRVTHVIEKMWMDGNDAHGKLRILPTPSGNIARTLIESGIRLGVSSRGSGNVDDHGNVDGFACVCVDLVAQPSAAKATPKPVYEAFNAQKGRTIEELAEAVNHDKAAQKHLQKALMEWIESLRAQ